MSTYPVMVVLPGSMKDSSLEEIKAAAFDILKQHSIHISDTPKHLIEYVPYSELRSIGARMIYESSDEINTEMTFEEYCRDYLGLSVIPDTDPIQFGTPKNKQGRFMHIEVNTRFDNLLPVLPGGLGWRDPAKRHAVLQEEIFRLKVSVLDELLFPGEYVPAELAEEEITAQKEKILAEMSRPGYKLGINATHVDESTLSEPDKARRERVYNKFATAIRLSDLDLQVISLLQEYMSRTCANDLIERISFAAVGPIAEQEAAGDETSTVAADPLPQYIRRYLEVHTHLLSNIAREDSQATGITISPEALKKLLYPLFGYCALAVISQDTLHMPEGSSLLDLADWKSRYLDILQSYPEDSIVCIGEVALETPEEFEYYMFFQQTILEVPEISAGAFNL